MKNLFVLAASGFILLSCANDSKTTVTTTKTDSSTHSAYAPAEGDVSYRNGKVVVWRNNEWKESDNDVTLDNGVIVRKNGEVVRDDKVIVLKDGGIINKSGRFFDKAGNALEDAWDATKNAAKDVKDEVKDAVTDDKKEKKDN